MQVFMSSIWENYGELDWVWFPANTENEWMLKVQYWIQVFLSSAWENYGGLDWR
jgi:hypothetical protein